MKFAEYFTEWLKERKGVPFRYDVRMEESTFRRVALIIHELESTSEGAFSTMAGGNTDVHMNALGEIITKFQSRQYTSEKAFVLDVKRCLRSMLCRAGANSPIGRDVRSKLKAVALYLTLGNKYPFQPGERIKYFHGRQALTGTVADIAELGGPDRLQIQIVIDGSAPDVCPWFEYDSRAMVSMENYNELPSRPVQTKGDRTGVISSGNSGKRSGSRSSGSYILPNEMNAQVQQQTMSSLMPAYNPIGHMSQPTGTDGLGAMGGLQANSAASTPIGFISVPQLEQLQNQGQIDPKTVQYLLTQIQAQNYGFPSQEAIGKQSAPNKKAIDGATSTARRRSSRHENPLPPETVAHRWINEIGPRKRFLGSSVDKPVTMGMHLESSQIGQPAIERLIGRRRNICSGALEFLVKFENSPLSACKWEMENVLYKIVPGLVLRFEAAHPELPIEVDPESEQKEATLLNLPFLGFHLEVTTHRWCLTNKITKQTSTKFKNQWMEQTSELQESSNENDSEMVESCSDPILSLEYPKSLGGFATNEISKKVPGQEISASKTKQVNDSRNPKRRRSTRLAPTEEEESTRRRKSLSRRIHQLQRQESTTRKRESWYDPVWCIWRNSS